MRSVCWEQRHAAHAALVAGDPWLTEALIAGLPGAYRGDADVATPDGAVVVERGRLGAVPDETLRHARLVVLLDPTTPERLRATQALAGRRGARLVVVPALATMVTAEHTFLLMLAAVRRLLPAYSDLVAGAHAPGVASRLTDVTTSSPNWVGMAEVGWLWGKTLGILGLGRVGEEVAARAVAFGMRVVYHDLVARVDAELRYGLERRRFDAVLRESDVVTLHLPLTPDTVRLIDAPELALMRPDAILINTAHGRLLDEGSLIRALRLGAIGGAGLDVFAYEPLPADSPLPAFDNVVLTPHVGGAAPAIEREHLAAGALRALQELNGEPA